MNDDAMRDVLAQAKDIISDLEYQLNDQEQNVEWLRSELGETRQKKIELENQMDRLQVQLELKDAIIARHERTLATAKYWIGIGADVIDGEINGNNESRKMRRFIKGEHDLT